jgi:hypothetical protein
MLEGGRIAPFVELSINPDHLWESPSLTGESSLSLVKIKIHSKGLLSFMILWLNWLYHPCPFLKQTSSHCQKQRIKVLSSHEESLRKVILRGKLLLRSRIHFKACSSEVIRGGSIVRQHRWGTKLAKLSSSSKVFIHAKVIDCSICLLRLLRVIYRVQGVRHLFLIFINLPSSQLVGSFLNSPEESVRL